MCVRARARELRVLASAYRGKKIVSHPGIIDDISGFHSWMMPAHAREEGFDSDGSAQITEDDIIVVLSVHLVRALASRGF